MTTQEAAPAKKPSIVDKLKLAFGRVGESLSEPTTGPEAMRKRNEEYRKRIRHFRRRR